MYLTSFSIRLHIAIAVSAFAVGAQYVIDSLSFGTKSPLSPSSASIPNWQLLGESYHPQILSDRVILTPPAPGNRRGAVWGEFGATKPEWRADVSFRASGPERGGGNLQIWFVKEGASGVGHSSLYTVGQFEGLVLVLDQYDGKGGAIRGFLNDGSLDYKNHHNVDSLSFGRCDYPYRNLGVWSNLDIQHGPDGLEVQIDGRLCFKSDNIKLPSGYYFGITAASAETPDSFEVDKFTVSTTSSFTREEISRTPEAVQRENEQQLQELREQSNTGSQRGAKEQNAAAASNSINMQFDEYNSRLQAVTHQVDNVFSELQSLGKKLEERHVEMAGKAMPTIPYEQIDRRLQAIEQTVQRIQQEVESRDYKEHLTSLQAKLKDTQSSLTDSLPETLSKIVTTSTPKMGVLISIFIAFQLLLAALYVVYKRRRARAEKKFL